jgi:hypothetical protein
MQPGLTERLALGECKKTTAQILAQMVQVRRDRIGPATEVHVVRVVERPVLTFLSDLKKHVIFCE